MAISRNLGRVRRRAYTHFEAQIRGLIWVSSTISSRYLDFEKNLTTKIEKHHKKSAKIAAETRVLLIFCDFSRFLSLDFAKN